MDETARDAVARHIAAILPLLERPAGGALPHPYLATTHGPHYAAYVYHWDHHHMALRFAAGGRPEYLRYLTENLLHFQAGSGWTPMLVSRDDGVSGIAPECHAQPFLAQGALVYAALAGDDAWAAGVFDRLARYLSYYETRYRDAEGLFAWVNIRYGGVDNDAAAAFFPPGMVVTADLPSWIHLEYRSMAELARRLGRADDVRAYADLARDVARAVNERLWNEDEGTYTAYDRLRRAGSLRLRAEGLDDTPFGRYSYHSATNLYPLYAGIAPPDRAARVVRGHLMNPDHFLAPWGVRSLSRASEFFNTAVWGNPLRYEDWHVPTASNWQGPVWFPQCYFMFRALLRYGFRDDAAEVMDRTTRLLANALARIGSFTENYDGETGAPLYAPEFASWNILADRMPEEYAGGAWTMASVFADE